MVRRAVMINRAVGWSSPEQPTHRLKHRPSHLGLFCLEPWPEVSAHGGGVFAHDETNVKITVCGSILNANSVDTCKEVAQEGVGVWLGTMYLIGITRNNLHNNSTAPLRERWDDPVCREPSERHSALKVRVGRVDLDVRRPDVGAYTSMWPEHAVSHSRS